MKQRKNLAAAVLMGLSLFGSGMTVFARENEPADVRHGQEVQLGDDRRGRGEQARGREMELGDDRGQGAEPGPGQVELNDDNGVDPAEVETQAELNDDNGVDPAEVEMQDELNDDTGVDPAEVEMQDELNDNNGVDPAEVEMQGEVEAQDDQGQDAIEQDRDNEAPGMANQAQPGDDKNLVGQHSLAGDDKSAELQSRGRDDGNKVQNQPADDRRGGQGDSRRGKG